MARHPFVALLVHRPRYLAAMAILVISAVVGCSDQDELDACGPDEEWNPVEGVCVPTSNDTSNDGNGTTSTNQSTNQPGNNGDPNGGDGPTITNQSNQTTNQNTNQEPEPDPCVGLECEQVDCPPGDAPTTLSGTVTIPSGQLPLPNVSVYVPNSELEPIHEGASCERCEDILSGDPVVQTTTDSEGYFFLDNVPVTDELPLVIQTGKWRRKVHISNIDACTENPITDPDLTRLPKNQSEGHIPRIAVTTGGWDALECLIYEIGLDDQEFTTENDDSGRVTIFAGGGSATQQFSSDFNGGPALTSASDWWSDLGNLEEYDIILHSCDYPDATPTDKQNLQDFADIGGRVFMTDLHREWLEFGTNAFQSVADWKSQEFNDQRMANIDITFPGGNQLYDWMRGLGALDGSDQFAMFEIWNNIDSVNTDLAERWIYSDQGFGGQRDHYFAFNTPVGTPEEQQCGRVVYSDLHVAAGGGASPGTAFPASCSGGSLSGQEQALIYMFFDLAACIAPECEPLTCEELGYDCGVHPDGCGGSIECGPECCVEKDEPCDVDEDCCDSLWCDDDTGLCTDRCRVGGERCYEPEDCCSGVCSASGGEEGQCLEG